MRAGGEIEIDRGGAERMGQAHAVMIPFLWAEA